MKEIKAFIRPSKLDDIVSALKKKGHCCMTITNCEGTGKYTAPNKDFPSLKIPFLHSKVAKIEMIYTNEHMDEIVETMQKYGKIGEKGDGLISLSEINEVVSGMVRRGTGYYKI